MEKILKQIKDAIKLRNYRKAIGVTQKYIADKCGIEQGNYSRMEQGSLKFNQKAKDYILTEFSIYRHNRINELQKEILKLKEQDLTF